MGRSEKWSLRCAEYGELGVAKCDVEAISIGEVTIIGDVFRECVCSVVILVEFARTSSCLFVDRFLKDLKMAGTLHFLAVFVAALINLTSYSVNATAAPAAAAEPAGNFSIAANSTGVYGFDDARQQSETGKIVGITLGSAGVVAAIIGSVLLTLKLRKLLQRREYSSEQLPGTEV